jgi:hypothetical protein
MAVYSESVSEQRMTKTDIMSHDDKTHRIEKKMHCKKKISPEHSNRNKMKNIIPLVQL